ncbi:MAG: carboxylating nicotinate-nucleotide diphosphorylase [Alphaproteobacteria bacterium]|nr:carboxylating nicotinate-nucleotide diphosphorylase [Alphaproteobacteria bacterium]MCD8525919.1 carboxylating nicotinate-nucleotide diphosphorylase [Alphaproteobacteria bacterium]MCD8570443.1 carboxylating nicotinate-nucleotide diphosphorylase [Alphaproteobacteria bacterium]
MLSNLFIEDIVRKTLMEDLGRGFDITGNLLIPGDALGRAVLRARQPGVLCGLIPALTAFSLTDPDFSFEVEAQDGDIIQPGDTIAAIEGPARALLTAERTALNFLIHLSGIATLTMAFVDEVEGTGARITCTRKTLPGLRSIQKYAVLTGGGSNHRYGLDDAILIKDNHIALAGSITDVLDRARSGAGHTVKIEIEVDTLPQLEEVLKSGKADIVMLDNFTLDDLKTAVSMAKGRIVTEASGGVNLSTVRGIAETGVDYISAGALTHSAAALDIGLDVEI